MDRSEIASLKSDLRRMQARVDELEAAGEEPTNRRNMLRGLGAAAAGAAVGGLAFARPAAATDGFGIVIGDNTQTAQSSTSLVATGAYSSGGSVGLFHLTDDVTVTNALSVISCLTIAATGLKGFSTALSASGQLYGAKLDAPVPLKLNDSSASGAPSQSSGTRGEFKFNAGDLWYCVSSSGSQRWRKLASSTTAGAFHAITPARVYDSRAAEPAGNVGILTRGTNRTVSIKDTRDSSGVVIQNNTVPAGATAVTANVTITSTTAPFGFLAVNPGGNTSDASSAINWSGANQTIANGLTLTLNTNRELTVVCGGGVGGDTHFIIDISGYYL